MRLITLRAFVLSGMMATLAAAQTQITTGVIQGAIVDPQGAVVQDASVEAKNVATNHVRALTSGGDGRFVTCSCPRDAMW